MEDDSETGLLDRYKGEGLMKIAICDDCPKDAEAIKRLMRGHEVRLYHNAGNLLAEVEKNNTFFDLYLLDIYIEDGMDGIRLAERIRLSDRDALICFVSASDEFYREAYDLYVFQYLIKPVSEEKVGRLLDMAEKLQVREKGKTVSYTWRKTRGSIPCENILYISSRGHILTITCKDGREQESSGKLSDLEMTLDKGIFCRCHQSYLVNLYQVDNMDGYELLLSGQRIPVSRRYYQEVKRRYQEILFEEVE